MLRLRGDKEEFQDQLAKVKAIPGRRYNAVEKTWELPNDLETLLKVVHTMEPEMPALLQGRIQKAKAELAEELVTSLPDDAAIVVPWQARLAPKQRAGIDFMAEHPHCLLADEMGSGKTVQAISTVYEYYYRRLKYTIDFVNFNPRVLVVCPNSVTGVWKRELEKWAGEPATVIDGKSPDARRKQLEEATGWVIVNWEKIRLMPELAKIKWDAVLADEAHRAKNRDAKQTRALWKLRAPVQLALTGTPIMNEPAELWAILHWLRPEQYTSYWAFFYNYTDSYQGYKGKPVILGVRNPDALRFELADKMVRRTKREIHADIPVKLPPQTIEIPMKPKQRKLYDEAVKAFWLEIAQEVDEDDQEALREALDTGDLEVMKLLIPNPAARMVRMRQIASSPALLGGPDESAKLDAAVEIIADNPEKPFVVFTWYKGTAELMLKRLAKRKISARGFTGDTPAADREPLAQAFQNGDYRVIVLTIMAGGAGIDLFRASTCLFVEQDWVPANNNQAIDRLHRKGQDEEVQAIFLQSEDSVETGKIAPKNRTKEFIVTSVFGSDE